MRRRYSYPIAGLFIIAAIFTIPLIFSAAPVAPGTLTEVVTESGSPAAVPLPTPTLGTVTTPATTMPVTPDGIPRTPKTTLSPNISGTAVKPTVAGKAPVRTPTTGATPPFPIRPGPAPNDPYTVTPIDLASKVHELINQQRIANGLGVLTEDSALAHIAEHHSTDMAANNFFDHVNPAGQNPTDRGTATGYTCRKEYGSYYTYGIAENIFQNNLYTSVTYYSDGRAVYDWNSPGQIAESTVGGWMNSSGHRKNILTPTYDREGIGVAISADDKVYITEDFC